jgi:hypothetical protein
MDRAGGLHGLAEELRRGRANGPQQQNSQATRVHDRADDRRAGDYLDRLDCRRARGQIVARAFQNAKLCTPVCLLL